MCPPGGRRYWGGLGGETRAGELGLDDDPLGRRLDALDGTHAGTGQLVDVLVGPGGAVPGGQQPGRQHPGRGHAIAGHRHRGDHDPERADSGGLGVDPAPARARRGHGGEVDRDPPARPRPPKDDGPALPAAHDHQAPVDLAGRHHPAQARDGRPRRLPLPAVLGATDRQVGGRGHAREAGAHQEQLEAIAHGLQHTGGAGGEVRAHGLEGRAAGPGVEQPGGPPHGGQEVATHAELLPGVGGHDAPTLLRRHPHRRRVSRCRAPQGPDLPRGGRRARRLGQDLGPHRLGRLGRRGPGGQGRAGGAVRAACTRPAPSRRTWWPPTRARTASTTA